MRWEISSILLGCLHFCIIMKNQLISVKSCINTTLSQWSCYFMILQVERRLFTTSRGTGFYGLKNFWFKNFVPPSKKKKIQSHAYWTPFCLKRCLDVCLIISMCVERSTVYISCSAWPWQVRNSWAELLWGFRLKDQCLNKICVLITHLHIQSMSHWNSITS